MRYLIAMALIVAPGSAWAATGDIGCIEAKLGSPAMQRIGDGVVVAVDRGIDPAGALDADRDALIAARDACQTDGKWSPEASRIAVSYTQGRATKLAAEVALKRDELAPATLAARYAALPIADRRSLIARASPGAIAAVTSAAGRANQRRHVLLYLAALSAVEFYPGEFAAS